MFPPYMLKFWPFTESWLPLRWTQVVGFGKVPVPEMVYGPAYEGAQ